MPDEPGYKYRAFISYSRNDREVAKRLQRLLEYFVLPSALRVVSAGVTRNARPLAPCFRDEDELVPGQGLPDRIRHGLESSEYLIVVCSRSSAKSEWVEREILDFGRLGRGDNILAVVIDGTPHAQNADDESLPRALRFQLDSDGQLTEQRAEPLWIDWRESTRSDRVTFLRIVAALLSLRSLDDLIRRDAQARRRAQVIRLSLAAATLVLFSAVAVAWFRERNTAEERSIQQAVSLSRTDFADDRVDAGLQRLQPFLDGRHAGLVEPVVRNVLGWAVPIQQQFARLTRPSLLRFRGALLLLDQNGSLHDLSGIEPVRIILSRDGRRLVLIQNVQVSVFDAGTGERLGQADTKGIHWDAQAFESPDGLLVVLGTFYGATNGGTNHFALGVSKNGTSVAPVFLSLILELRGIAVAGNCQGLLIAHPSGLTPNPFESLRFTTEAIEAPQAIVGEIFSPAEETADPFGSILQQDFPESQLIHPHHDVTSAEPFKPVSASTNPLLSAGCADVKSDSLALHAREVTTGLSDPVTLATGSDFEPESHWARDIMPTKSASPVPGLCPESAACPVVDGRGSGATHTQGEQQVNTFMDDRYGAPPVPRGASALVAGFDMFAGNPVLFEYYHHNSGTDLAVCRTLDGRPACYEESVTMDEHRTDDFLRSRTGRYIFWKMGGTVIDLQSLHKVMNLRELPSDQIQACDFTPDESRFVCAAGGRLAFYQAGSAGAFWPQSTTSPSVGPLQLGSGQKMAGLLALDNDDFISARSDGLVGRFDSSGSVQWQLHVAGIGPISDVLPSPERAFILLIGQRGMRILSRDGFVQSAPLAPPAVLAGKRPLEACLDRSADQKPSVDLDDAGNLHMMCGENDPQAGVLFVRPARTAEGAVGDLMRGSVCAPPLTLSPIDALKSCTSH